MRIAIVAISDPWASSHGGTLRTRAFARAWARLGHEVSCFYPSTAGVSTRQDGIEQVAVEPTALGARAWPGWVRAAKRAVLPMPTHAGARSPALLAEIERREPEVVLVSQLPYAWYADQLPGALLWLDHSDLWSDFLDREIAARSGVGRVAARRQQRHLVDVEIRSSSAAAVTTTAGWGDAQLLERRIGDAVGWLPTPVTAPDGPHGPTAPGDRPTAGFLANFGFWPNLDALQVLNESWAPRLLELGWRVVVAGLGSDEIAVTDGIEVMGPVADVGSFYASVDVTLAPIRLGGGMKVKVVESLVHGRPVVATSFAMAGFPPSFADAVHVVDADDPSFEALVAGPRPTPAEVPGMLAPFSDAGFTRSVAELAEGLR